MTEAIVLDRRYAKAPILFKVIVLVTATVLLVAVAFAGNVPCEQRANVIMLKTHEPAAIVVAPQTDEPPLANSEPAYSHGSYLAGFLGGANIAGILVLILRRIW